MSRREQVTDTLPIFGRGSECLDSKVPASSFFTSTDCGIEADVNPFDFVSAHGVQQLDSKLPLSCFFTRADAHIVGDGVWKNGDFAGRMENE